MTYTSGPWEWLYAETHHDGIGRVVTAQVVDVATSQCVVEFSNTSHSEIIYEDDGDGAGSFFDVQARANARLISAAPCMHQALKKAQLAIAKCLSVGGIQQPDESPDDWWPLLIEAQKEIAAAIRKSERGEV